MKKIFDYIITFIFGFIPIKKIIVFESTSDFCDSSKALFDCCISNKVNDKYKIYWIVDDKSKFSNIKLKNVYFKNRSDNFFRIYYCIFAKFCFYTHTLIGTSKNKKQIRYFITHAAMPIKNSSGAFWNYKLNTYINTTSEFTAKYRLKTFGGGYDRVLYMGMPRNDLLFADNSSIKDILNINSNSKVILWLPTFKHHSLVHSNAYNDDSIDNDISLLTLENMKQINENLKANNIILIVKFHPSQDMSFVNSFNFSNVLCLTNNDLLEKNIDFYNLLGTADSIITDFSSVYIDYLLLDRPIAFELSDFDKYSKGKGFVFDDNPLSYMPGEKIYNLDDFMSYLHNIANGNDLFSEDRKKMIDLCHKYKDGNSSKRILKFLNII